MSIHSDTTCAGQLSVASNFVGSYSIQAGECLPLDYTRPTSAPFFLANCTAGGESFRFFTNANCTQPLGDTRLSLDGQCQPFPLVTGLSVRGRCTTCPPPAPPAPEPATGLSGGAIAGIVIGCLAGLAALGGLVYALTRKKPQPVADYPMETSQPVTTVKELEQVVIKETPKPVQTTQTVQTYQTTQFVPAAVATTAAVTAPVQQVSQSSTRAVQQFIRT